MVTLEHFIRALYLPKESLMAMFTAYSDASHKGGTVSTTAGFVAKVNRWEAFETAWPRLLPRGITVFNMADYASSQKGWEAWRGKREQRDRLMKSLINCIRQTINTGFGVTVDPSDYGKVNTEYELQERVGNIYGISGIGGLGKLRSWAKRHGVDYRKILCLFEDGDQGQDEMIKLAKSEGFDALPRPKKAFRAFDACGILAWKVRDTIDKSLIRQLHITDPISAADIRRAFREITPLLHDHNYRFREGSLRRVCEELGCSKRP